MRKFLLGILCLSLCLATVAQKQKEIPGTFEIACKVFNYNFKRTSAGLYTFRLENPGNETVVSVMQADSLAKFETLLDSANTRIGNFLEQEGIGDEERRTAVKDSLVHLITSYKSLLKDIRDGLVTLDYLYAKTDSFKKLEKYASAVKINGLVPDTTEVKSYTPFSFLNNLSEAAVKTKKIVENKTFTLNDFEQGPFEKIVTSLLKARDILFWEECKANNVTEQIQKKATALFFEIKSRLDFNDDEPVTAYLKLKTNSVNCYIPETGRLKDKSAKVIDGKFQVENVSVEFEDGAIKNLFVDLKFQPQNVSEQEALNIRFKNVYPISISTRTDPDDFEDIRIFAGQTDELRKHYKLENDKDAKTIQLKIKDTMTLEDKRFFVFFYLSDLLDYLIVAENDKEDYSPANTVVNLNKASMRVELKKEKRSKILTAKAFTDFNGFQNDQPNGLVQLEASKRIILNTNKRGSRLAYYNWFNYGDLTLAFTKIEKNQNAIPLTYTDLDSSKLSGGKKGFRVKPIDIFQFQKSSFEVASNIVKINFPEVKYNLQINANVGIMKINLSDTIQVIGNNQAIKAEAPANTVGNTLRWGASIILEVKPENRYGASIGWEHRRLNLLNDVYSFTKVSKPIINTFWFDGFLRTNDDNKLFFRVRLSYDNKFSKDNFSQMQLGYQVNLFKAEK